MFNALTFRGKTFGAIETIHGAVEGLVRFVEIGRHQVGVVEFGKSCVGMGGAGIQ